MKHFIADREKSATTRTDERIDDADIRLHPVPQAPPSAGPAPAKGWTLAEDLSLVALTIPFAIVAGGILLTALQPVILLVLAMLLPALAPLFALLFIFLFLHDQAHHAQGRT
jgi:hypothetical protein